MKILIIEKLKKNILTINPEFCIYAYGGYGTGIYDKYSDIDLLIHCKKVPNKSIKKQILNIGTEILFKSDNLDVIKFDNKKIDLRYMDNKELKNIINENSINFLTYVIYTKSLTKPNSIVKKAQETFNPTNFIYSENEIKNKLIVLKNDLEKLNIAFKRNDTFYINYLKNYMVERIIKIIYSLNKIPYIYPKKSHRMLKNMIFPKNINEIEKDLIYLITEPDEKKKIQKKINKLNKIIKSLMKE